MAERIDSEEDRPNVNRQKFKHLTNQRPRLGTIIWTLQGVIWTRVLTRRSRLIDIRQCRSRFDMVFFLGLFFEP